MPFKYGPIKKSNKRTRNYRRKSNKRTRNYRSKLIGGSQESQELFIVLSYTKEYRPLVKLVLISKTLPGVKNYFLNNYNESVVYIVFKILGQFNNNILISYEILKVPAPGQGPDQGQDRDLVILFNTLNSLNFFDDDEYSPTETEQQHNLTWYDFAKISNWLLNKKINKEMVSSTTLKLLDDMPTQPLVLFEDDDEPIEPEYPVEPNPNGEGYFLREAQVKKYKTDQAAEKRIGKKGGSWNPFRKSWYFPKELVKTDPLRWYTPYVE